MSEENQTSAPAPVAEPAPAAAPVAPAVSPAAPAAPAPASAAPAPVAQQKHGLSAFLKVSIVLLVALSLVAIALVFTGPFEGKFERIFSTFVAFAVFVALTAFDTNRERRNDWYAPVALLANSYILALLLIVIWMTPANWSLGWEIFWKGLLVIVVTRAVVAAAQVLLNMGEGKPRPLNMFGLATSLMATVTGILFTAPVAIELFNLYIPDLYWRFAVAALLLTALGLAITVLLRWAYTGEDREAARREKVAQRAVEVQHFNSQTLPVVPTGAGQPVAPAAQHSVIAEVPAVQPEVQSADQPEAQQLLPWPLFPDGRPYPAGPDGQPDFEAAAR